MARVVRPTQDAIAQFLSRRLRPLRREADGGLLVEQKRINIEARVAGRGGGAAVGTDAGGLAGVKVSGSASADLAGYVAAAPGLQIFSGNDADPWAVMRAGGAGVISGPAYSHEVISAGFWPGAGFTGPAFYAYAVPKPEGLEREFVRPACAGWNPQLGEFILMYDDVRAAESPRDALLEFLQSTYEAGARLGGWDRAALEAGGRKMGGAG